MIKARLYRQVTIRGETQWLYLNGEFPVRPIDGETMYVGRKGEEYEEVQVLGTAMRMNEECVHIWLEPIKWPEDELEPDETLESWTKHFERDYGWVRCKREPLPWASDFSESSLLKPRRKNQVFA